MLASRCSAHRERRIDATCLACFVYETMNTPAGFIVLGRVAVDRRIFSQHFACQLGACKGACCVEGEAGAPLQVEEAQLLAENIEQIRPFVTQAGQAAIDMQGAFIRTAENDLETPLVDGKECAYAFFEEGIARCGIEAAYQAGAVSFPKPISCHLYPIRVYEQFPFDYLIYEEWSICKPACAAGSQQGIRVYEFVREALIRKYGQSFFDQLHELEAETLS